MNMCLGSVSFSSSPSPSPSSSAGGGSSPSPSAVAPKSLWVTPSPDLIVFPTRKLNSGGDAWIISICSKASWSI